MLDNPVWNALSGPQAAFAEVHGSAQRYRRDVSVFSAVDSLDAAAWTDLGDCAEEGSIVLVRPHLPIAPEGWKEMWRAPVDQMVLHDLRPSRLEAAAGLREVGPDDIEAVLDLIKLAGPGPFVRGTPQLGCYVGVFDGDQLVAMAGERMRLPGMTEVSAVCAHPDARGRGLGEFVSHVIAASIVARGEQPFLHVAADNHNAIRIYDRLGFRHHQRIEIAVYERVS